MTPKSYYNEIDPAAAHILRAMIDADLIAPGDVDTRSIKDVHPDDLSSYTQCHFFAGGGFWSVAARLAGWPDDRELWTGSCPCQPFSAAGKGLGTDDPRHLWPDFFRLIRARRPAVVMGQVAGAAGYGWFDGVRADLAGENFSSRAVDFPAGAIDAPHQRNRLCWVAVGDPTAQGERQHPGGRCVEVGGSVGDGRSVDLVDAAGIGRGEGRTEPSLFGRRPTAAGSDASSVTLGDAERSRLEGQSGYGDRSGRQEPDRPVAAPDVAGAAVRVAQGHATIERREGKPVAEWIEGAPAGRSDVERADCGDGGFGSVALGDDHLGWELQPEGRLSDLGGRYRNPDAGRNGTYWSDAEWIICHDSKARRAKPGLRLLVDGLPGRVDLWRVGGNAIVPEAAAEVIAAFMDVYGLPTRRAA